MCTSSPTTISSLHPTLLRRVIILDPPLAISIHKASTALIALRRAAAANARSLVAAQRTTETEQHGGDQEAGE